MSGAVRIKIIWFVVFLSPLFAHAVSCESKLTLTEARASADFRHFAKANRLTPPSDVNSIAGWLKLNDLRPSQVVVINLTKFFGDNVIFGFSTIAYLRETFDTPFLYVSPSAQALNGTAADDFSRETWPITFMQHRKRGTRAAEIVRMKRRFESFLEQHVRPGALVFYDLTTLDKADEELASVQPNEIPPSLEFRRALARRDVTAIGLSTLRNERIHLGITGLDLLARAERLPPELRRSAEPHLRVEKVGALLHAQLRGRLDVGVTTYESWLRALGVVFGHEVYMQWIADYFVRPEFEAELEEFKREAGFAPHREFAFLNINTFGADKVRDLEPVYSQTLDEVIDHVITRYSTLDLIVRFPEYQFGPEVQRHALALAARWRGRVAFIPFSRLNMESAIIKHARWSIMYDSGPFHLAAFRPSDRVVSVSLWTGSGDVWRKPDQAFVKITDPKKSHTLGRRIVEHIDRVLEPAASR